jgi:hypothetical protein
MTDYYTPLSQQEPVARLCTRIAVKLLRERHRYDLLAEFDEHGGRLEDDEATGGVALYVGSEIVTRVTPEAIRLGLDLQPGFENDAN